MSCTDGKCGQSVGKGGFLTLDDFEGLPSATAPIGINWPARDLRTGSLDPAGGPDHQRQAGGGGHRHGRGRAGQQAGAPLQRRHGRLRGGGRAAHGFELLRRLGLRGHQLLDQGQPGRGQHQDQVQPAHAGQRTGGERRRLHHGLLRPLRQDRGRHARLDPGQAEVVGPRRRPGARSPCRRSRPTAQAEKQILALSFSQTGSDEARSTSGSTTSRSTSRPGRRTTSRRSSRKPIFDEMFKTPKAPFSYQGLVDAIAKYGTKWGGSFGGRRHADRSQARGGGVPGPDRPRDRVADAGPKRCASAPCRLITGAEPSRSLAWPTTRPPNRPGSAASSPTPPGCWPTPTTLSARRCGSG